jgi:hypothetical protein
MSLVRIFPYIFLGYMALGAAWLYIANKRNPGLLADMALDLAQSPVGLLTPAGQQSGADGQTIDLTGNAPLGPDLRVPEEVPASLEDGWAAEPA